ncbi:ferrochelatase [Paludibacterium paludis]|uniref:Ferrochelatase n=1 Tax=Paludibacterium paludis TaxID=1225769 RepID=A0A918UBE5_9NEIS|nr:ferrochelatase [Paludibacterium paludis]GGY22460.1 ferrochelatase [Paludibacterium paludis]
MSRYLTEPEFRHDSSLRTGIVLINLGTPDSPTPGALRPYLREFLSDPRVIEIPRALWWVILNGFILTTRPAKSAAKYASIWRDDGSPLLSNTRSLTAAVSRLLAREGRDDLVVDYAMRYGNPSVESVIRRLREQGVDRLLIVPLYPQYAASSSGTALDEVFRVLMKSRNMPEVRTVRHFHDDPGYIGALAASISRHWQANGKPDKLMMSFHGVPRFTRDKGDPYYCECRKTARLLAERLELADSDYVVTFQSRFGRAEWLTPYTSEVARELGQAGTGVLDVVCPGFVGDCLETLEEIAMEVKQDFLLAGGGQFRYIPCLNDNEDWATALTRIVQTQLGGWFRRDDGEGEKRSRAARDLGAKQ